MREKCGKSHYEAKEQSDCAKTKLLFQGEQID